MLKYNHTFQYEVSESDIEGVTPHTVTMTIDGEVTLSEMLERFQNYLLAVGFIPPDNTVLDFVPRDWNLNHYQESSYWSAAIVVTMAAKIAHIPKMKKYYLFLDDQRIPEGVTWVQLPKVDWVIVRDYYEFVNTIEENGLPEFIAFDHDLGFQHMRDYFNVAPIEEQIIDPLKLNYKKYTEKTGYDCAKWLVKYCEEKNLALPNYLVHSMNHIGKRNIESYLESYIKSTLK